MFTSYDLGLRLDPQAPGQMKVVVPVPGFLGGVNPMDKDSPCHDLHQRFRGKNVINEMEIEVSIHEEM